MDRKPPPKPVHRPAGNLASKAKKANHVDPGALEMNRPSVLRWINEHRLITQGAQQQVTTRGDQVSGQIMSDPRQNDDYTFQHPPAIGRQEDDHVGYGAVHDDDAKNDESRFKEGDAYALERQIRAESASQNAQASVANAFSVPISEQARESAALRPARVSVAGRANGIAQMRGEGAPLGRAASSRPSEEDDGDDTSLRRGRSAQPRASMVTPSKPQGRLSVIGARASQMGGVRPMGRAGGRASMRNAKDDSDNEDDAPRRPARASQMIANRGASAALVAQTSTMQRNAPTKLSQQTSARSGGLGGRASLRRPLPGDEDSDEDLRPRGRASQMILGRSTSNASKKAAGRASLRKAPVDDDSDDDRPARGRASQIMAGRIGLGQAKAGGRGGLRKAPVDDDSDDNRPARGRASQIMAGRTGLGQAKAGGRASLRKAPVGDDSEDDLPARGRASQIMAGRTGLGQAKAGGRASLRKAPVDDDSDDDRPARGRASRMMAGRAGLAAQISISKQVSTTKQLSVAKQSSVASTQSSSFSVAKQSSAAANKSSSLPLANQASAATTQSSAATQATAKKGKKKKGKDAHEDSDVTPESDDNSSRPSARVSRVQARAALRAAGRRPKPKAEAKQEPKKEDPPPKAKGLVPPPDFDSRATSAQVSAANKAPTAPPLATGGGLAAMVSAQISTAKALDPKAKKTVSPKKKDVSAPYSDEKSDASDDTPISDACDHEDIELPHIRKSQVVLPTAKMKANAPVHLAMRDTGVPSSDTSPNIPVSKRVLPAQKSPTIPPQQNAPPQQMPVPEEVGKGSIPGQRGNPPALRVSDDAKHGKCVDADEKGAASQEDEFLDLPKPINFFLPVKAVPDPSKAPMDVERGLCPPSALAALHSVVTAAAFERDEVLPHPNKSALKLTRLLPSENAIPHPSKSVIGSSLSATRFSPRGLSPLSPQVSIPSGGPKPEVSVVAGGPANKARTPYPLEMGLGIGPARYAASPGFAARGYTGAHQVPGQGIFAGQQLPGMLPESEIVFQNLLKEEKLSDDSDDEDSGQMLPFSQLLSPEDDFEVKTDDIGRKPWMMLVSVISTFILCATLIGIGTGFLVSTSDVGYAGESDGGGMTSSKFAADPDENSRPNFIVTSGAGFLSSDGARNAEPLAEQNFKYYRAFQACIENPYYTKDFLTVSRRNLQDLGAQIKNGQGIDNNRINWDSAFQVLTNRLNQSRDCIIRADGDACKVLGNNRLWLNKNTFAYKEINKCPAVRTALSQLIKTARPGATSFSRRAGRQKARNSKKKGETPAVSVELLSGHASTSGTKNMSKLFGEDSDTDPGGVGFAPNNTNSNVSNVGSSSALTKNGILTPDDIDFSADDRRNNFLLLQVPSVYVKDLMIQYQRLILNLEDQLAETEHFSSVYNQLMYEHPDNECAHTENLLASFQRGLSGSSPARGGATTQSRAVNQRGNLRGIYRNGSAFGRKCTINNLQVHLRGQMGRIVRMLERTDKKEGVDRSRSLIERNFRDIFDSKTDSENFRSASIFIVNYVLSYVFDTVTIAGMISNLRILIGQNLVAKERNELLTRLDVDVKLLIEVVHNISLIAKQEALNSSLSDSSLADGTDGGGQSTTAKQELAIAKLMQGKRFVTMDFADVDIRKLFDGTYEAEVKSRANTPV